jgi:hypothetical protein
MLPAEYCSYTFGPVDAIMGTMVALSKYSRHPEIFPWVNSMTPTAGMEAIKLPSARRR